MMRLHLPTYLGGELVELQGKVDGDESIYGWVDEYGTIWSSRTNQVIGDLIQVKDREMAALVLKHQLFK